MAIAVGPGGSEVPVGTFSTTDQSSEDETLTVVAIHTTTVANEEVELHFRASATGNIDVVQPTLNAIKVD